MQSSKGNKQTRPRDETDCTANKRFINLKFRTMKKNVLIKAACMVAVLGAMILWSCSQEEEIE